MATLINFKRGLSLLKTHFNRVVPPSQIEGPLALTSGGNYALIVPGVSNGITIESAEPWVNVNTNQLWVDGMPINVELRLSTSGAGVSLSDIMIGTDGKAYRTLNIPPAEVNVPPVYGIMASTIAGRAMVGNWASQSNTPSTYRSSVPNNNSYALVDSSTNGSSTAAAADVSIKHISQIDVAAINDVPVNVKIGSIMKHYNNSNHDMLYHDIVLIDGGLFGGTQLGGNIYNPNGEVNRPTGLEFEIRDLNLADPQPNGTTNHAEAGVIWQKKSQVANISSFVADCNSFLESNSSAASTPSAHIYSDNGKSFLVCSNITGIAPDSSNPPRYHFVTDTITIPINDIVCDNYDASYPYFEAGADYYIVGYLFYDSKFVVSDMILSYHVPA